MLISAVFHYRHEIQTAVEKLSDFFSANYNFCSFDLTCPQKNFFSTTVLSRFGVFVKSKLLSSAVIVQIWILRGLSSKFFAFSLSIWFFPYLLSQLSELSLNLLETKGGGQFVMWDIMWFM